MTDVLVIGANPTGLILASHLISHGISVKLIDHRPGPDHDEIGSSNVPDIPIILSCPSLELLSSVELLDNFVEEQHKLIGTQYNWNHRTLIFKFTPSSQSPTPYSLVTTYKTLEKHLLKKFVERGGTVDWGMKPVTLVDKNIFIEKEGSESNNFEDREIFSPKWILACESDDNKNVRELIKLGGKFRKVTKESFTVPCQEGDHLSDDYIHLLPAKGNFLNFAFYHPQADGKLLWLSDISALSPKLRKHILYSNNISLAEDGSHIKTTHFILPPNHNNMIFVGNSANNFILSYLSGINSNIHESCNLAWKIPLVLRNLAPKALILSKEEKQGKLLPGLTLNIHKMTTKIPFYSTCSSAFIYWFLRGYKKLFPSVTEYYTPNQSLKYINSAFIKGSSKEKDKETTGLKAGNRAIDVRLEDGSYLLAPLKGAKHILLFFKDRPELISAIKEEYGELIETVVVKNPQILKLYNATTESLFIIRPDRYIGYSTHSFKLQELISYLLRIFSYPSEELKIQS